MSGAMGVAAHGNRGQQFTVGNISNGLIYLRYYLHSYILLPCNRLREEAQLSANNLDSPGWAFYRGGF